MKLEVVSQNNCKGCLELKTYLDNVYPDLEYDYKNIDKLEEDERQGFVQENYIMSTPVSIVRDEDGEEVFRVTGFQAGNTTEIDLAVDQL